MRCAMSRKRRRVPTVWIDWTAPIAALFEPYGDLLTEMNPPRRVRCYAGQSHTTLVAVFNGLCDVRVNITLRLPRNAQ